MLQIGTDMLLIITSTGDELLVVSTSLILNDLNPKIANFVCSVHFNSELRWNGWREPANRNYHRLLHVSWASAEISCYML